MTEVLMVRKLMVNPRRGESEVIELRGSMLLDDGEDGDGQPNDLTPDRSNTIRNLPPLKPYPCITCANNVFSCPDRFIFEWVHWWLNRNNAEWGVNTGYTLYS